MPKGNNDEQIKVPFQQMMDWLFTQYEFKRDVLKNYIQFRPKNEKVFRDLVDSDLNTISITMELKGLRKCDEKNVERAIMSSFNPGNYDPLKTYFDRIGKKNGTGAIEKLTSTVITTNPELWSKYLKKWLVASVANYMERTGCQNHMCLVLTGGQGKGKTTWLNGLCPKELSSYLFTGRLDLKKHTDTTFKLADYWFINIEEQMKNLNREDANAVKALITLSDIKGRKPYGRIELAARRIANFMASTNDDDFLTDTSGSRRFLPFRVTDIKLDAFAKLNMDDVWAEALHIYLSKNFKYWITADDQVELELNNKSYINITQEHEYVSIYFSAPSSEQRATHIVPASVLRDYISAQTGNKNLKDRNIGVALSQLGFEQISHRMKDVIYPIKAWKIILNNPGEGTSLFNYINDENQTPKKVNPVQTEMHLQEKK